MHDAVITSPRTTMGTAFEGSLIDVVARAERGRVPTDVVPKALARAGGAMPMRARCAGGGM